MSSPASVLATLLRTDPARPRITTYDDTDAPTRGERIELSAKVFANWVNKAANLLQEEWEIQPGSRILLDLPAHWRSAYWAFAAWSVGATVVVPLPGGQQPPVDAVITSDAEVAAAASADGIPAALVTLAALARASSVAVPSGVVDEAREVATYADQFVAWEEADEGDPALVIEEGVTSFAGLATPGPGPARQHLVDPTLQEFLPALVAQWAAGGSVVLTRGSLDVDALAAREASEGIDA